MGFFVQSLREDREDANRAWITILGLMTLILLGYQLYIEVSQIRETTLWNYATDIINWLDILQYIPTAWIILVQIIGLQLPDREA